ncbi:MAG: cytochrome c5 family protein, partial [Proteobacteria bacterium]|nr:cytochrome c5 family protein [Burkholderiales bacterium]
MSTQHGEGSGGESQGLIRTPKQLIIVVLLAFVVPVAAIVMLALFVTGGKNLDPAGSSARSAEMIAERLRPVGRLWVAGEPPPPGAQPAVLVGAVKVEKSGEAVYQQVCAACHTSGVLNSPKIGDKTAWGKLIPQGLDYLTKSAIAGVRQMPARGGNPALTDLEMRRAVVYLANASGAGFKEPPAPVAPVAGAAGQAVATAAAPA